MNVECFLDTNILVYAAASHDVQEKRSGALEIIASEEFGVSAQVLQEFSETSCERIDVSHSREPFEIIVSRID